MAAWRNKPIRFGPPLNDGWRLAGACQRIAKREADNLRLAERIQSSAKGTPSSAAVAAAEKKPSANPLVAMPDGGTRRTSPAMRAMIESAIKQKIEGKLRLLKSRLILTPEQENSIRKLLAQQLGGRVFRRPWRTVTPAARICPGAAPAVKRWSGGTGRCPAALPFPPPTSVSTDKGDRKVRYKQEPLADPAGLLVGHRSGVCSNPEGGVEPPDFAGM